jgi:hypothetical protein
MTRRAPFQPFRCSDLEQPIHEAVPQEPASGPSVHVFDTQGLATHEAVSQEPKEPADNALNFPWEAAPDSEASQSRNSGSTAHGPRAVTSYHTVPDDEIERRLLESRLTTTGSTRKGQSKSKPCSALYMSRDLSDKT